MNGRNAKGLITATCLLALAGCGSSPEEKLYEAFKCGKVATLLEHERDGNMALKNAEPYMRQMKADGGNPAQVAMEMNQRFQDDVPLHRLAIGGQMAMLADIYQSDECQALYQPASGLTQSGQINLAGCEVPAGLTPEEAEQIQCAPTGTASAVATADSADMAAASAAAQVPEPEMGEVGLAEAAAAAAAGASAAAADATPQGMADVEVIKAAIAGQAQKDGGSEFAEARRSAEGDLNGDGIPDLAVLYTLEGAGGGNNAYGYLATFVRGASQLKLTDTVSLAGSAQGIVVKDGEVHLKLLSLGPGDLDCCPSVEENAIYVLHGGKLLQVQAQP